MCSKQVTVSKQLIGINKTLHNKPLVCDHADCSHRFKVGEQAISKNGGRQKTRYFCLDCYDSLYI